VRGNISRRTEVIRKEQIEGHDSEARNIDNPNLTKSSRILVEEIQGSGGGKGGSFRDSWHDSVI
jgi:hypothetical protein